MPEKVDHDAVAGSVMFWMLGIGLIGAGISIFFSDHSILGTAFMCGSGCILAIGGIWSQIYVYKDNREIRRAEQGLCRYCGYDKRKTPNRCPECGKTT